METYRMDAGCGRSFSITIAEATVADERTLRDLVEIDLQTFSESTFSTYTARAFLQSGRVFVLRADGRTIGTCVVMRSFERADEATVLSMGIRPGWRGRGLGLRFLDGILARLADSGLATVSLLVSDDNRRALRLYEEAGFGIAAELPADHRTGERYLVLRRPLQPVAAKRLGREPAAPAPAPAPAPVRRIR